MHLPYKAFQLGHPEMNWNIIPLLNPYIPELSDPWNPENVQPHSSNNSYKTATP